MGILRCLFNTNYDIKLNLTESLIVYISVFYLLIVVDAYFVWEYSFIMTLVVVVLLLATLPYLVKYRDFGLSKSKSSFFVSFFIFAVISTFQIAPDSANIFYFISKFLPFIPVFLLILWPNRLLYCTYRVYFKIIIFFSIGSIIISVLSFLSLLDNVPSFELEAHESLHENNGVFYRVYLGILTECGGFVDYFLTRACGFLCEPGHWAITLSFLYVIERILKHAPNIVIIICGLLTFSSVFIIVVIIAELCVYLRKGNYLKLTLFVAIVSLLIFTLYSFLPSSIKDPIDDVFLGRNLSDFTEALNEGSATDAFDTRANNSGLDYYYRYIHGGNLLWGEGQIVDDNFILSDYRFLLVQQGLIGLFLVIVTALTSVKGLPLRGKIPILSLLFIVLLHRAWMFQSAYLCLMAFMGRTISTVYLERKTVEVLTVQKKGPIKNL